MSEEKDSGQAERELAEIGGELAGLPDLKPQLTPSPGLPECTAVFRRMDRLMGMLHTFPPHAQDAIRASLTEADRRRYRLGSASPENGTGNGGQGEIEAR